MSAVTIDHLLAPVRVRPARPAVVIPFPAARARRPAPSPRPRLHVTRRGRLTLTLLVASVVAVTAVVAIGAVTASAPLSGTSRGAAVATEGELRHVVVTPGDTLWRIASSAAGEGQDVRDVIAEIRHLNGLESSAVMTGQRLVIPVTA